MTGISSLFANIDHLPKVFPHPLTFTISSSLSGIKR